MWKDRVRRATSRGNSTPVVDREAAQVGVPLGLVHHHLEAQHRHVVTDLVAQIEQEGPRLLVGVAVDGTLHQVDDHHRQVRRTRRGRHAYIIDHEVSIRSRLKLTLGSSATRSTSSALQAICSRSWSSKTTASPGSISER